MLGDMHGNLNEVLRKLDKSDGCQLVIQLGDMGFAWPGHNGLVYMDRINEKLEHLGKHLLVILGNHENWDYYDYVIANNPRTTNGLVYARSNILVTPRLHYWKWDNKTFLAVPGAISIDKTYRLWKESQNGVRIYWPQEAIPEDIENLLDDRPVDYLLTHEASNRTPWQQRLKEDHDSYMNRIKVDKVIAKAKPKMHFHGHYHEAYDWVNEYYDDTSVETYGLAHESSGRSSGILDTETNTFTFF